MPQRESSPAAEEDTHLLASKRPRVMCPFKAQCDSHAHCELIRSDEAGSWMRHDLGPVKKIPSRSYKSPADRLLHSHFSHLKSAGFPVKQRQRQRTNLLCSHISHTRSVNYRPSLQLCRCAFCQAAESRNRRIGRHCSGRLEENYGHFRREEASQFQRSSQEDSFILHPSSFSPRSAGSHKAATLMAAVMMPLGQSNPSRLLGAGQFIIRNSN